MNTLSAPKFTVNGSKMLLLACLWATIILCAQSAAAQTILVVPKGVIFPFWQSVCIGATDAAQDNGVEIIWRGPRIENKIQAQQYILDMYVDRNIDAVVIAPSHATKLNKNIERAVGNGTTVVVIDSPVTTTAMSSYIATENYEAGKLGARLLLASLPPNAKMLLMGNVPGNASTDRREQGFIDYVNDNAPQATIVTAHFKEGTYTSALHAAKEALSTNQDLDGIFAVNEVSSVAVLHWLTGNPKHRIPFIAFDYSAKLEEGLVSGAIDSIIAQSPYLMGYLGIETAARTMAGKSVNKRIVSPTFVIGKENLGDEKLMKKVRLLPADRVFYKMCFK